MTPLRCVDWHDVPAEVMTRLYDVEAARWRRDLYWDTTANWIEIERGRQLRTVGGVAVVDALERVVGWGFALAHQGTLQVGEIVSSSPTVTDALVGALITGTEGLDTVSAFSRDAVGAAEAFARYGLDVAPHQYLVRSLDGSPGPVPTADVTPWRPGDVSPAVDLLQRAYPPVDPCRPCAPSGSHDAWEEYLIRLVGASGCGVFDPHASGTIAGPDGRLRGLVLASRLSPDVGHIAQVAVDVESRGAGMGRHLVDSACACLAGDGCRLVTLFVDERNRGALALYASLGFRFGGRFLSAGGAYPRRSTRPLAGGATITRR